MDVGSNGITFTTYRGSKDGVLVQSSTHRDTLDRDEVLLRVTHSALCATDELYLETDMCLGHECAGVVQDIGPETRDLRVGDRVGFGYQHSACGNCAQCLGRLETFCPEAIMYGFGDFDTGSMASHAVLSESFVYKNPAALSSESASALMCAGATVFNVLDMYNVKPTERVGVVGIGGLGHLAILFAAKWGCEVVAFSGTESKKDDAIRLGATEFYATKGKSELEPLAPIDHLLVTTSAQIPWSLYLPVMASPSSIYPLSLDQGNLNVPYLQFLTKGLRLQGSIIAPRAAHRRMLNFAAFHGVRPIVARYELNTDGLDQAVQDMKLGKLRYKAVLYASG